MDQSVRLHSSHTIHFIRLDESMFHAFSLMNKLGVRHLPVTDHANNIIGMLSDRDIQRAMQTDTRYGDTARPYYTFEAEAKVEDYMSYPVETIGENASVADAARAMLENKISSLIVTSADSTIGIITTEDLLRFLVNRDESSLTHFKDNIKSVLASSPVGGVAHSLANSGI